MRIPLGQRYRDFPFVRYFFVGLVLTVREERGRDTTTHLARVEGNIACSETENSIAHTFNVQIYLGRFGWLVRRF